MIEGVNPIRRHSIRVVRERAGVGRAFMTGVGVGCGVYIALGIMGAAVIAAMLFFV